MIPIALPDDVAARLIEEAQRRGVSVQELLETLVEALPEVRPASRGALGFVALGTSTTGLSARAADAMLAEGFGG